MKILCHGKFFNETIEFVCNCCGCIFQAESGEYSAYGEANYEVVKTKCPECDSKVERIYL